MLLTTRTKTTLARFAYYGVHALNRVLGRGDEVEATRRGIRWRLDLREGIDLSIYLLGCFDREAVRAYERLVGPGDVVLDVGANVGAHTLELARLVGSSGRVLAFEPTGWGVEKLRANLDLNPDLVERVAVEHAFLVDAGYPDDVPDVYASWPVVAAEDVHEKLRGRLMSTQGARATTLDAAVESAGLERVDLVKIDVDGHECSVLRGAAGTISRHRPRLIIEIMPYGLSESGTSTAELVGILDAARYRLTTLDSAVELPLDAAALERDIPDGAGINTLASPM